MLVATAEEAEHRSRLVAGLLLQLREIDAETVDARRRAGLKAVRTQWQLAQALCQRRCRRITGPAAIALALADMDAPTKEGAGGQHHVRRVEVHAHGGTDTADSTALQQQVVHRLLEQFEVRLRFDGTTNGGPIQVAIRLAARGAYRRTLARVQATPLDPGRVRCLRHHATERVDLAHQMALADATNGRVAAHLADGLDVVGQQQRARTRTCRGQCGLGAGVAATDHDHVIAVRILHRRSRIHCRHRRRLR